MVDLQRGERRCWRVGCEVWGWECFGERQRGYQSEDVEDGMIDMHFALIVMVVDEVVDGEDGWGRWMESLLELWMVG